MGKPLERRVRNREYDAKRRQTKPWRAFYDTARWKARRLAQLTESPLCERCAERGLTVVATVAHHVEPHRGDPIKFFEGALASSCAPCHDILEQKIERAGFEIGADLSGRPLAHDHPWNGGGSVQREVIGTAKSHPKWFRPTYVPLTIVCGPDGSGKSTFVAKNASSSDVVICFDTIACRLFGRGPHGRRISLSGEQVGDVLRERNEMLADLMRAAARKKWTAAWLIVSEPKASHRQWWADTVKPASVVVLETPAAECKRRVAIDASSGDVRVGSDARIDKWWSDYSRRSGDDIPGQSYGRGEVEGLPTIA